MADYVEVLIFTDDMSAAEACLSGIQAAAGTINASAAKLGIGAHRKIKAVLTVFQLNFPADTTDSKIADLLLVGNLETDGVSFVLGIPFAEKDPIAGSDVAALTIAVKENRRTR